MAVTNPLPEYPAHWEADVVLVDGGTTHLRPIQPSDADALQSFHVAQSERSRYFRFFTAKDRLTDEDLDRFTKVDHRDRVALIATRGDEIIGVGRYDRINDNCAEVAFNIADSHHGRGIGSVILEHLAAAAREQDIGRFVAEVLPGNTQMLHVFTNAGYEVAEEYEDGVISVAFDIDPTQKSVEVMESREHRAESQSITKLVQAQSVVVVGASRNPSSIGRRILHDLITCGYEGAIHAVNPEALEIEGVFSHGRMSDVPGPVDLAVIVVPSDQVEGVIRDCAVVGVHGVVVVTSGYAETGPQGVKKQRELVRLTRSLGIRLIGPSSFGLLNADPKLRLNASLAPYLPKPGGLGLFTQSAALAVAMLAAADRREIGVSSFLSAGNRADVSGNDLMQYWDEDDSTSVVGMYLESIGNPRKFSRIARRLSGHKPVIVIKSGFVGTADVPGHTVRAASTSTRTLDEMFRQAGVVPARTISELLDIAQVFVHQPLPTGRRVGVVSNSASLSALIAENADGLGLAIARPVVSLPPQSDAETFREALSEVFADDNVDCVVTAFVPPLVTHDAEVARALVETAAAAKKTTVACFLGMVGVTEVLEGEVAENTHFRVPSYQSPEDAVYALAKVADYAQWQHSAHGQQPAVSSGVNLEAAEERIETILAKTLNDESVTLTNEQCCALLREVGIEVWPSIRVEDFASAKVAAEKLGWPVAVKASDEHLRHRTDLGGVRLDVRTSQDLEATIGQLRQRLKTFPGARSDAHLEIQHMAPTGVASVIRADEDPLLGPVISFGLGGDAVELLGDISYRVPPMTERDVQELISSVRAAPRLFGHRGSPKMDVAALADVVTRLSQLTQEFPQIRRVELNPVVVAPKGAYVLGATVKLARAGRFDDLRRVMPQ